MSHCFRIIAMYWFKLSFFTGVPLALSFEVNSQLYTAKSGLKKLKARNIILLCGVQRILLC